MWLGVSISQACLGLRLEMPKALAAMKRIKKKLLLTEGPPWRLDPEYEANMYYVSGQWPQKPWERRVRAHTERGWRWRWEKGVKVSHMLCEEDTGTHSAVWGADPGHLDKACTGQGNQELLPSEVPPLSPAGILTSCTIPLRPPLRFVRLTFYRQPPSPSLSHPPSVDKGSTLWGHPSPTMFIMHKGCLKHDPCHSCSQKTPPDPPPLSLTITPHFGSKAKVPQVRRWEALAMARIWTKLWHSS